MGEHPGMLSRHYLAVNAHSREPPPAEPETKGQ